MNTEEEEDNIIEKVNISVPDLHYQELEEDFEKYQRGEVVLSSWEEVKKRIWDKYQL